VLKKVISKDDLLMVIEIGAKVIKPNLMVFWDVKIVIG
jgi:hypothetical protein